MKFTLSILSLLAVSAISSHAASITFLTGGRSGHQFLLSDGSTRVTTGSVVRIGFLSTPGDTRTFTEFATTTIANPITSQAIGGFIKDQTTQNGSTTGVAGMKSGPVVVWVIGQNGQQGMWTSTLWTAPAALTPESDSSYDITLGIEPGAGATVAVTALTIDGYNPSRYSAPVTITVGTGGTAVNQNGASFILATPVPEPTMSALGAVMGLGLMMRRRRA